MNEPISIIKTNYSILSTLGLSHKKGNEVLRISHDGINYNSTLGNIGKISSDDIQFIELTKYRSSKVIKIGLTNEFKVKFKYQLKKFCQALSETYYKESGAEILVFPQDTDIEISELAELLKVTLNK